MKKWIIWTVALTFALGITSMGLAAEEKKPAEGVKAPAGMPLSAEEKAQISDTKKKATVKEGKGKGAEGVPMSAEEKAQVDDTKKKATKKKGKAQPALKKAPLSAEEKAQAEKMGVKPAEEKPAEKK